MDSEFVPRIIHGSHLYGGVTVLHTDFWYAGGYYRWSLGHLTVDQCVDLAKRRVW